MCAAAMSGGGRWRLMDASDDKRPAEKNRDIEVLRAFAVFGVLLHHLAVLLAGTPGAAISFAPFDPSSGVDLFFVISGYVIARSLLPRLDAARAYRSSVREVCAFWVKRAFRLWPTAWVWLAIILVVAASWRFASEYLAVKPNVDAAIAGALHFANVRFAESFSAFPYGASFHYWTLSLEEQFYFLLPLVALISRRWLVPVLLVLIVVEMFRPLTILAVVTRTSALLTGVLVAIFSATRMHRSLSAAFAKVSGWIAFPVVLSTVLLVAWVSAATPTWVPFHYSYLAAAGGVCVLFASFDRGALCPPGPWPPALLWMGARSYAIYVIHVPAFLVLNELATTRLAAGDLAMPLVLLAISAGAFALVFALAELNFRIIETPLRRVGASLADRISRGGRSRETQAA